MSTDMTFEQEWAQARLELEKLSGCTVYTVPDRKPNEILDINEIGFTVRAEQVRIARWSEAEDRYRRLRMDGILYSNDWYRKNGLRPPKGARGSFFRALLAMLSTAKEGTEDNWTVLRYVPECKPPRLKES